MRKPAFGDTRAPNLWNRKADGTMGELGFWTHRLDPCLYLSTREATSEDDDFLVFEHVGKKEIVDGIMGLHVDDFGGGGEGIETEQDIEVQDSTVENFRGRCQELAVRFKFGKWDFRAEQNFTGAESFR